MKHTENDEIELGLEHRVGNHYYLKWRYKGCRKFLCLRLQEKWHNIMLYNGISRSFPDPNDDINWYTVTFDLSSESDVQHYKSLVKKMKTKKDLYDYYNVEANRYRYAEALNAYKNEIERVERNVKELVK